MGRNRILVAEDNVLQLKIITGVLEKGGYLVCGKTNGLEVLAVLNEFKPDLLLLDMRMPELNGLETCQKVKEIPEFKNTPVMFLTAYKDPEIFIQSFQAGAIDYISKPFSKDEILARVGAQLKYLDLADERVELIKLLDRSINDRVLGQLSIGLAHNFNNMLTSAMGYCQLIDMTTKEEDIKKRIGVIKKALDSMHRMITNLAEFADRTESAKNEIDLVAFIRDKTDMFVESSFPKLKVSVESGIASDKRNIETDTKTFATCLFNILNNSVEHGPTEETQVCIDISIESLPEKLKARAVGSNLEESFYRIRFTDNGAGFGSTISNPSEIFEPFWTTKKTVGVGLGLSVVLGFVNRHKGYTDAYNGVEKGAVIEIYLPVLTK